MENVLLNVLRSSLGRILSFSLTLTVFVFSTSLSAASLTPLEVQKVTENVYALVGEMEQRSPANLANNATFGVVVTQEGIVLIDPGGSYKGAAQIDATIRKITDKPVKIVINTGGQDHRWLGNSYWKEKGAQIIASHAAVDDQKDRGSLQMSVLEKLVGSNGLAGTKPVYADTVFEEEHEFVLGGVKFSLFHKGGAHTPGDSYVYVPSLKTVFTGDIVYLERLLGVGPQSASGSWVKVFEAMASLSPKYLVPGHGHAASLEKARTQTYDYLVHLRKQVAAHLETGGEMKTVVSIDQNKFKHLRVFDSISRKNAMSVFAEMEFE
jgi:glyoxylase-like metal-dependent hydrolase (beta-lactamase superfamily II)